MGQPGQQHLDDQGGMEVLRMENENLFSEIANLQYRYESLKLENEALISRNEVLEVRAPKDELVKQNANLVAKVTKYKAVNALKGLEVIELKIIKEKYILLMRKFGSAIEVVDENAEVYKSRHQNRRVEHFEESPCLKKCEPKY